MARLPQDQIPLHPLEPNPRVDHSHLIAPKPTPTLGKEGFQYVATPPSSSPGGTAFTRLPESSIKIILWLSDPNTFASLVILNRRWNSISQNARLYAHHLSQCPSYALSHYGIPAPSKRNDLCRLKALFAREVRRNLFEAFMHPSETLVNLISTSASSSAAFPRGEAFRFVFSSQGQTLLALSSSRIFVIDLLSDPLTAKRELKTVRRPLAAAITNDASLLALLSTKHQVNIYALTETSVSHLQVIILDNTPSTLALANKGTVLAAAYEGGVEVFSLAMNALSTDRRAVRCEAVDSLSFSADGSMLLGSSYNPDDSNTVAITAPFYTENNPSLTTSDLHSRMWTTQILFPQNSSTCSHAVVLNSHMEGDINWLFVYDRSLNSYRAVRADDTRTGVAYFLGPSRRQHATALPSILPAVDLSGELALAGFSDAGVYVYGIPEKVDSAPDMSHVFDREERSSKGVDLSLTSATGYREPLMVYSPPVSVSDTIEDDFLSGSVDWRQSLFVRSRPLTSLDDAIAATWVEDAGAVSQPPKARRLAMVAPGGVGEYPEEMYKQYLPVDGGRILLLDFDYAPCTPVKKTITIEVGGKTPEMLPEHRGSLDVEVDLAKRRSVWGMPDPERRRDLGRSMTARLSSVARRDSHPEEGGSRRSMSEPSSPIDRPNSADHFLEDGNPSHRHPSRSRETLQRSATATGLRSARYPARPPLESMHPPSATHVANSRSNIKHHPHLSRQRIPAEREIPPLPNLPPPERALRDVGRNQAVSDHPSRLATRLSSPFPAAELVSTVSRGHTVSSTSFGRPNAAPDHSAIQARQSDVSVSTLTTTSRSSPDWRTRRPSGALSRAQTLSNPVSPISSPRSIRDRRPQRSDSSITMYANILSPMPDFAIPQSLPEEPANGGVQDLATWSSVTPGRAGNAKRATPLKGARLQTRLNYPVPPMPPEFSQGLNSSCARTAERVGQAAVPTKRLPPDSNSGILSPAPLASHQVPTVGRHGSDNRRRPLSIPSLPEPTSSYATQRAAIDTLSPGTWGTTGIPSDLPSNQGRQPIKHRPVSRPHPSQRPNSASNLPSPSTRHYRLGTTDGAGLGTVLQQGSVGGPNQLVNPISYEQRRTETYPSTAQTRKQRKADKSTNDGSGRGRRAKLSRCVVM